MQKLKIFVLAVSIIAITTVLATAQTFTQTKRELMNLYAKHPYSFYCHCRFDRFKRVFCTDDEFTCRNVSSRCAKIEFDHLYPASAFGKFRACWRTKSCSTKAGKKYRGRRCCEKTDSEFALIEADPHNLVPVIGQINGDRRDYFFGDLHEKPYQYGNCQVVIDKQAKIIQPPTEARGWIGRDYLYMHQKYKLPLTVEQTKLYNTWDKQYPPTQWETKLNQEINDDNQ